MIVLTKILGILELVVGRAAEREVSATFLDLERGIALSDTTHGSEGASNSGEGEQHAGHIAVASSAIHRDSGPKQTDGLEESQKVEDVADPRELRLQKVEVTIAYTGPPHHEDGSGASALRDDTTPRAELSDVDPSDANVPSWKALLTYNGLVYVVDIGDADIYGRAVGRGDRVLSYDNMEFGYTTSYSASVYQTRYYSNFERGGKIDSIRVISKEPLQDTTRSRVDSLGAAIVHFSAIDLRCVNASSGCDRIEKLRGRREVLPLFSPYECERWEEARTLDEEEYYDDMTFFDVRVPATDSIRLPEDGSFRLLEFDLNAILEFRYFTQRLVSKLNALPGALDDLLVWSAIHRLFGVPFKRLAEMYPTVARSLKKYFQEILTAENSTVESSTVGGSANLKFEDEGPHMVGAIISTVSTIYSAAFQIRCFVLYRNRKRTPGQYGREEWGDILAVDPSFSEWIGAVGSARGDFFEELFAY